MAQDDLRFLTETQKYDLMSRRDPRSWYRKDYGLQKLERIRYPWYKKRLPSLEGLRVLDIGCGGGILAEDLARDGAHVVGIDPSRETIRAARAHAKELGLDIDYRVAYAEKLRERRAFDVVFAVDVLEHVEDLEATLDAAMRALKPGGWFGFLTHNATLESFTEVIWRWEYVARTTPRGRHDFHRFITPEDLAKRLRERGARVTALGGIAWQPQPRLVRSTRITDLGLARKKK